MMWNDNYMYYCENTASKMYPKTYSEVYPYVKKTCEREDHPSNPMMNPFPNEEKIDEMVENIYNDYKKGSKDKKENEHDDLYRINGFDIRDLIRILLLRELLDRRRRRFPRRRPFRPGYGGFGGYDGLFY